MSSSCNTLMVFSFFIILSSVIFLCNSFFSIFFLQRFWFGGTLSLCSHFPNYSLAYFLSPCYHFCFLSLGCFCPFLHLLCSTFSWVLLSSLLRSLGYLFLLLSFSLFAAPLATAMYEFLLLYPSVFLAVFSSHFQVSFLSGL